MSFIRKRSSCASGRGYVPCDSIGFWVAMTMKGAGSGREMPSTVTCRSCIASSSALCVFAGARLISSAKRSCAKMGPATKVNAFALPVEDVRAGDVARHQVRRELDALEARTRDGREHARDQRLAEARRAFDEHVTLREEADEDAVDELVLPDDDASDGGLDLIEGVRELFGLHARSLVFSAGK